MKNLSLRKFALVACTLLVSVALVGCEEKGPAEKAGQGLDNVGKDIKNGLDPRGPAQKAGDKIDETIGK